MVSSCSRVIPATLGVMSSAWSGNSWARVASIPGTLPSPIAMPTSVLMMLLVTDQTWWWSVATES